MINSLCGCGRPAKYMHNSVWSCNKFSICRTYDQVSQEAIQLRLENMRMKKTLEKIVNVNAMDYEYKTWAKNALDEIET